MSMTSMTMKPQARTRPAAIRTEGTADYTLPDEILAWSALVGFAAMCFFIFALAVF
jgi:hypothetical protein